MNDSVVLYVQRPNGTYVKASKKSIRLAYAALESKPASTWADWGSLDNGHCSYTLGYGAAFCSLPDGHTGDHRP